MRYARWRPRARNPAAAGDERAGYRGQRRRRVPQRAGLPVSNEKSPTVVFFHGGGGSPAISTPMTGRHAACNRNRRGRGLRRLSPPAGSAVSRRVRGRLCGENGRHRPHRRIRRRRGPRRRGRGQRRRQSRRRHRDRLPRRRHQTGGAIAGLSRHRRRRKFRGYRRERALSLTQRERGRLFPLPRHHGMVLRPLSRRQATAPTGAFRRCAPKTSQASRPRSSRPPGSIRSATRARPTPTR